MQPEPPESSRPLPVWGLISLTLLPLAALSSILAAWLLDTFVQRPVAASISTLLPGLTRAMVLVLLVCGVAGLVAGAVALASRERPRWLPVAGLAVTAFLVGALAFFE